MASKSTTTLRRGPIVYGPYVRQSPLWVWLLLTGLVVLILLSCIAAGVYLAGHALRL